MRVKRIRERILQMLIVLIGISFFTFLLTYLSPGDPVTAMYSATGDLPDEAVLEATRKELGLDRPFILQYINWLTSCLHGDFGTSYSMHRPVLELMRDRLFPTLKLALTSLLLMLLISVPLGVLSAVYKGRALDRIVRSLSFLELSMPNFWLGMLLLYLFAIQLKLLPVISTGTGFEQLILPSLTLALAMAGKYTRQVRTAVLEELKQDYVIGARARGLNSFQVLFGEVLPNSLFPLVTMLALSLGSLLGGTAIVEVIFSYPGLGSLAVSAISARDYPVIQAYVLFIALIYMLINFAADISYEFLDPRLREEEQANL